VTRGIREPATTTRPARRGRIVVSWLSSTDHKVIGYLYLITSFGFFLFGGVLALVMRAQLARPGQHLVSNEQ
jgi:cytochrome c oxidase subunit 1